MDPTERAAEGRPRLVTMNQIVAWNMAWYRHEAKMTQQDVGEYLGWTARTVSEAERSWESGRTREFDAQLLTDLAIIFGVPVVAFFLPPEGEDAEGLHFADPAGDPRSMTDLMWLAMHDLGEDEHPALTAYRRRLRAAHSRYLDAHWAEESARYLDPVTDESLMEDRIALLESKIAIMRDALAAFEELPAAMRKRLNRGVSHGE
jgi:transcriptional regulator with XRE-family HTH domain